MTLGLLFLLSMYITFRILKGDTAVKSVFEMSGQVGMKVGSAM